MPSRSQAHQLRQPSRIDDAVHRVYRETTAPACVFLIGIGQARRELKEAIDEDPDSAFAHQWYSLRLLFAGHLD